MNGPGWQARIHRAQQLARTGTTAASVLTCYAEILTFQSSVYEAVRAFGAEGLDQLIPHLHTLLARIPKIATPELAQAADLLLLAKKSWRPLLQRVMARQDVDAVSPADLFFAYTVLQPYTEFFSERNSVQSQYADPVCPYCGNKPVLSVLRPEGDGGRRSLVCFLCGIEWAYRRILCPSCGEEDKEKLPVISAAEFDYIRIEACKTSHTYVKAVDMTKNGLAVPQVDELAAMSLDLWASENGYTKLQLNLFGV